jgi:hypothetical protein
MRWDRFFDDLHGQWEAAERAELAAEVADRTRSEAARHALTDRLRPSVGSPVTVAVLGGATLTGVLGGVGPDWLALAESSGSALIPLGSVLRVRGLDRAAAAPSRVGRRLGLRYALRGLAQDRRGVTVLLVDGSTVTGTLDRVGADHVELAGHPVDEPRRPAAVRDVWVVPFSALAAVRAR